MNPDVSDVDHIAVRVSDLNEALGFYRDTLDMEVRDRERYEKGEVPFVAVVAGGRHIHLVPIGNNDEATEENLDVGGEHICLLLRSSETDTQKEVEELAEYIREEGYEVEEGEPHRRYGAYGYDWAVYVRDPDGRRVELKMH